MAAAIILESVALFVIAGICEIGGGLGLLRWRAMARLGRLESLGCTFGLDALGSGSLSVAPLEEGEDETLHLRVPGSRDSRHRPDCFRVVGGGSEN